MQLSEQSPSAVLPAVVELDGGIFGSRPSSHRPHSMRLFESEPQPLSPSPAARAIDVLAGAVLGAAFVYFFGRR